MKIYDISPPLHPGIAVWPGDVPFQRTESLRLSDGASVNLSSITLSSHTGAHADAPSHFLNSGKTIDQVDLQAYIGPAKVVSISAREYIRASDLDGCTSQKPVRLLVRCNPGIDPNRFPDCFIYFSPQAAERIGKAGVKLIGTDAPSVDRIDSKDLAAHHAFARYGTAILENLNLRGVSDGEYELIALPLRIAGGDGSPVRAILREMG